MHTPDPSPVRPERPLQPGPRRLRATPVRVLVAEDDDAMRAVVTETLRGEGYDVVEARNGLELRERLEGALAGARSAEPPLDLIVSDIRMPGASGLDVVAWLRAQRSATPAILITAFGDTRTHETARRLGQVLVLDKPFDMDDLLLAALMAPEMH